MVHLVMCRVNMVQVAANQAKQNRLMASVGGVGTTEKADKKEAVLPPPSFSGKPQSGVPDRLLPGGEGVTFNCKYWKPVTVPMIGSLVPLF